MEAALLEALLQAILEVGHALLHEAARAGQADLAAVHAPLHRLRIRIRIRTAGGRTGVHLDLQLPQIVPIQILHGGHDRIIHSLALLLQTGIIAIHPCNIMYDIWYIFWVSLEFGVIDF